MSTSLNDLPTDPLGGGNISLTASENKMPVQQQTQQTQQVQQQNFQSLDQDTISKLINGLQQAVSIGATKLPSRDIPRETINIVQDPEVQPNYIPEANVDDYIKNELDTHEIVNRYNKNKKINSSLDEIYDEIHIPLLIAILYFIFQLPFFKKFLRVYLPFLFMSDYNLSFYGLIFCSFLFSMVFYFTTMLLKQFDKF